MHNNVILRSFGLGAALTLGALGLGCGGVEPTGGDSSNPTPTSTTPTPAPAPAFPEGSGQAAKAKIAYPAGPYGINVGSIAPDFEWLGFQNASVKKDAMQTIHLSDFYNPHAGDATYVPADPAHDDRLYQVDLYGVGTPKPKVLLVDIGSVWCPPCNQEAKTELPARHAKYKPLGGEFLLQLGDSATQGKPATQKDLFNWTTKYKVDFPSTIDPDYKLGELFPANAWPANIMIDTRTMKIVRTVAGVPDPAFWTKYETFLNAQ
jgi:hypothetical protein